MPSFDVVSEVDMHEAANAVDQANREVGSRFDFKGTNSSFELKEDSITMQTETEFQLKQMTDILVNKLSKRQVDIACLDYADPEYSAKSAKQVIKVQQGISSEMAKKIVKSIKDSKLKVQASIQGEQVRVTGKKRDDLQTVIAHLKEGKFALPLQFNNFRD